MDEDDDLSNDYFERQAYEAWQASIESGEHPSACSCDFCWYAWDDDESDCEADITDDTPW